MAYSLEEIQKDMSEKKADEIYIKYIIKSENWYFEHILEIPKNAILQIVDEFKYIVSNSMKVSFNNIAMVGSGKTGYSFSPDKNKLYKEFNTDEMVRKISDIDIAIISDKLFLKYWDLLRKSYNKINSYWYDERLYYNLYRGYINSKVLQEIDGCRPEWNNLVINATKSLNMKLYIEHEINYRLYRSWEDFEDYHIDGINKIKRIGENI